MVARYDQRGRRDPVDELSGLAKLLGLGPLGQIPGEDYQIGLALGDEIENAV